MLNIKMLEKSTKACIDGDYKYFAIKSTTKKDGKEINTVAIYEKALLGEDFVFGIRLIYDDNLEYEYDGENGMKISGFTYGNSFDEIEKDLI